MNNVRQPDQNPDPNLVTNARMKANAGRGRHGGQSGRFYQYRGALLLALAVLVLWLNLTFLKPLVMGALFAIVLYPLMNKGRYLAKHPNWKAALITVLFALVVMVPIGLLVFLGADAAIEQIQRLQGQGGFDWGSSSGQVSPNTVIDALGLRPLIERLAVISPLSFEQIKQMGARALITAGTFIGGVAQNMLANLPGVIVSMFVILITIFFLLVDGPRAAAFIRRNSVFGTKQTDHIFSVVSSLCYSVIVATIVSGATQAALIGLSCLITGTSGVLLIILVAFLASFFPVVGTAPVTLTLTAAAFIRGDFTSGIIFLVFVAIVGLSDNVVRPYVLKGGAELHPLIGFVAAFGALDAIGFSGLFIGPVVAGLFFSLLPMVTSSYSNSPGRQPG